MNTELRSKEILTPVISATLPLLLLGRHLSNISNPHIQDGELHLPHSCWAELLSPAAMHAARLYYLEWINANVIDPPKATADYTVEQLQEMSMVGLYAPAIEEENQSRKRLPTANKQYTIFSVD